MNPLSFIKQHANQAYAVTFGYDDAQRKAEEARKKLPIVENRLRWAMRSMYATAVAAVGGMAYVHVYHTAIPAIATLTVFGVAALVATKLVLQRDELEMEVRVAEQAKQFRDDMAQKMPWIGQ